MVDQLQSFENFNLNKQLLRAVQEIGYEKPTPIQEKAIPLALSGHDILGIAQTGTGKTAAFVLPLLFKVKYAQGQHPRALILAPTRELVMQIEEAVRGFGKYTDLRYVCLYGGLGPKPQIEKVQQGVDILIATPGRFLDLYKKGVVYTRDIKTMILDEADKMLDMGFLPQIRAILEIIPVKRQNMLFSATFSDKIENLSHEFLEFPERVEVAPQASTADTIDQYKYYVPNVRTKLDLLEKVVSGPGFDRGIVFTKSRKNAEEVFRYLQHRQSGSIRVIHANKGQNTRINSMDEFKKGQVKILVATDVAARGLDISMVSHVVNFDVPLIYEDYVHRIGRTGRAENEGTAVTFINPAESYHFEKIEAIIRKEVQERRIPKDIPAHETPFDEQQGYEREIDKQKKGEDPEFKGAFHEKKSYQPARIEKPKKSGNKNSKAKRNRNQMKTKGKWKK